MKPREKLLLILLMIGGMIFTVLDIAVSIHDYQLTKVVENMPAAEIYHEEPLVNISFLKTSDYKCLVDIKTGAVYLQNMSDINANLIPAFDAAGGPLTIHKMQYKK